MKAFRGERILWLTRVCQVAWKFRKTPRDWQPCVIILISKKGDRKQCTNYRGISLVSWFAKDIIYQIPRNEMPRNSGIKTGGWPVWFSSGSQHHEPNFYFRANLEILEFGKVLFACFVDLEKIKTEFFGINFPSFCSSKPLIFNCYALLSCFTADRRFVFW